MTRAGRYGVADPVVIVGLRPSGVAWAHVAPGRLRRFSSILPAPLAPLRGSEDPVIAGLSTCVQGR